MKWNRILAILVLLLIFLFIIFFFYESQKEKVNNSFEQSLTYWKPAVGSTWQIQFTNEPIDQSLDVEIFDIDYEENNAVIESLHKKGKKVVCYIDMGSWENFRQDRDAFPKSVIGNVYNGFENERWLDIRQIDILGPLLQKRIDLCKEKGFDGIDPDNLDGYTNDTGFPLTYRDQIRFNIWIATEAHKRGLAVGLKNSVEQIPDLVKYFDWLVTEDCFIQGWCKKTFPFIQAGKPVFAIEYQEKMSEKRFIEEVCPFGKKYKISFIYKSLALDEFYKTCNF